MYEDLREPYQVSSLPSLQLGGILLADKLLPQAPVNLILKTFNRHGLIAGATGSGKTKTMQVLCEQLSLVGVPSLVMDIKGDVSGLAVAGQANESLHNRAKSLDLPFTPRAFPVELLTLSESHEEGVPLRATVDNFGPLLFARMLDLNETQSGVVTILFEYAKTNNLTLIDLADFKALLQFSQTAEAKKDIESNFGSVASASSGTIMRRIIELEAQGGGKFFGEPSFNVKNLIRTTANGQGVISILRLLDMQDKPKLFSTFMLKMLSDLYQSMPELGDLEKPKLVLFIDEAHLIFKYANKAVLDLIDTVVKLIRSKGIGIIFCTQLPNDIPESVLSQLGLKIQHSLRAFTAKDRKAMKLVASNFPTSKYYRTEDLLTALGIGEALVSALDAKGQPTPLVHCLIRAPESRMGVLSPQELQSVVNNSTLVPQYEKRQPHQSLQEVFAAKWNDKSKGAVKTTDEENSLVSRISKNKLFRQVLGQIMRDLTRTILSALGLRNRR